MRAPGHLPVAWCFIPLCRHLGLVIRFCNKTWCNKHWLYCLFHLYVWNLILAHIKAMHLVLALKLGVIAHFGWTNPDLVIWCGETFLLVSWCVCGKCDIAGNDEDRGKSRRLGVEDQGWSGTSQVLSCWTIRRLGDVMCDPHRTHGGDEEHKFSGLALKPVATVCQWFGLKTTMTISWFGP
jgi:hypothetical protein